MYLQLALWVGDELNTSAGDSRLASLNNSSLEDNDVALFPHLCSEGLAWQDDASEADLEVFECAVLLVDVLARDAEGTKAVEDRSLETTHLAEVGVKVERVAVTVETVQSSLVFAGLLLDNGIGLALWWFVGSSGSSGAGSCRLV